MSKLDTNILSQHAECVWADFHIADGQHAILALQRMECDNPEQLEVSHPKETPSQPKSEM